MTTEEVTAIDWTVGGEERLYRSLRRYWHPVLYASELGDGPRQVTLLDERIVVVRLAGEVRAFTDRCAQRGGTYSTLPGRSSSTAHSPAGVSITITPSPCRQ